MLMEYDVLPVAIFNHVNKNLPGIPRPADALVSEAVPGKLLLQKLILNFAYAFD